MGASSTIPYSNVCSKTDVCANVSFYCLSETWGGVKGALNYSITLKSWNVLLNKKLVYFESCAKVHEMITIYDILNHSPLCLPNKKMLNKDNSLSWMYPDNSSNNNALCHCTLPLHCSIALYPCIHTIIKFLSEYHNLYFN